MRTLQLCCKTLRMTLSRLCGRMVSTLQSIDLCAFNVTHDVNVYDLYFDVDDMVCYLNACSSLPVLCLSMQQRHCFFTQYMFVSVHTYYHTQFVVYSRGCGYECGGLWWYEERHVSHSRPTVQGTADQAHADSQQHQPQLRSLHHSQPQEIGQQHQYQLTVSCSIALHVKHCFDWLLIKCITSL